MFIIMRKRKVLLYLAIGVAVVWISYSQDIGQVGELPLLESERDAPDEDVPTFHNRGTNSIKGGDVEQMEVDQADDYDQQMQNAPPANQYREIDCNINNDKKVKCRKEGNEVFLPFSFVKSYFEVFGEMSSKDGYERLEFHHANSIPHPPRPTYTPSAMFMAFDHYNVENRDRVKCITASEGVPITTQWGKEGYHYAIQVAQFGLSHHAKHIVDGPPEVTVVEDGGQQGGEPKADWRVPDKKSRVVSAKEGKETTVEFLTSDSLMSRGITLGINEKVKKCISLDLKFSTNGSLAIAVETTTKEKLVIHYVWSSQHIWYDGKTNIYLGLGERHSEWRHLARDLKFDVMKGLHLNKGKNDKSRIAISRIVEVRVHGHGWLDNLTLSSTVHMDQFYHAADWLVRSQDTRGGWPIMVARKVVSGVLELPPGWYSAMGQGQAMSVLVRAYLDSKQDKYLKSAVDALKLFDIDAERGGVRAKFMGVMDWYEEYPTTPSIFVLNGFIYSLLGLYDLKETATGDERETADRIYSSGMKSLKAMIGLYDSGVGTLYDLRHITAGLEPNRARWDYHTTHINQILQLMVIDDDPIFKSTVQRWLGYLQGRKSRHN